MGYYTRKITYGYNDKSLAKVKEEGQEYIIFVFFKFSFD